MKINLIPRFIRDFVKYHKRSTEQIFEKLNQLTGNTVGNIYTVAIIASQTKEILNASKYLSATSDTQIVIVTRPEQLNDLHIDRYIISNCAHENPLYGQIMDIVRTRLKNYLHYDSRGRL